MERLKNLKMLLTILFIAAAGSLFLYDGKRTSDIQWQTAEETASETECLDMTPEENTDKAETESACAEPEMIYVYICGHVRQPDVYSWRACLVYEFREYFKITWNHVLWCLCKKSGWK